MRYEDYQGPEIREEKEVYASPLARLASIAARVVNTVVMLFFVLFALGSWLAWREEGSSDYYYGIFAFSAMAVLAFPPLGTFLRRRLGPRSARWIRWGGCALVYFLWGAVMVL